MNCNDQLRNAAEARARVGVPITRPWHAPSPIEQYARMLRVATRPVFDLAEAVPRVEPLLGTAAMCDWTSYPDSRGMLELRERIAERENAKYGLRLTADHIVITNGATEAISLLIYACVPPGQGVRVRAPSVFLYRDAIENNGAVAIRLDDRGFAGRAPLWLVNNPSNPDGSVLSAAAVHDLIEQARGDGALLALDQIYDELLYGVARPREDQRAIDDGVLAKVNSVSKSFGAPGIRIGWIACHPDLAQMLSGVAERQRISVSAPSQCEAARLVRLPLDPLTSAIAARRQITCDWLASERVFEGAEPKAGLFCWLALRDHRVSAGEFCDRAFREEGVWLLPGSSFWEGSERHVRLSFGSRSEIVREGLARLARLARRA